jgi:hypothetical protein
LVFLQDESYHTKSIKFLKPVFVYENHDFPSFRLASFRSAICRVSMNLDRERSERSESSTYPLPFAVPVCSRDKMSALMQFHYSSLVSPVNTLHLSSSYDLECLQVYQKQGKRFEKHNKRECLWVTKSKDFA